jgi:hypothetical protein
MEITMTVTTIRLSANPGRKRVEHGYSSTEIAFRIGGSTPTRTVHVSSLGEISTAVAHFGKDVLAANPEASFILLVSLAKGQRKPRGFDAADKTRQFGQEAFLRSDVGDEIHNCQLVLSVPVAAA